MPPSELEAALNEASEAYEAAYLDTMSFSANPADWYSATARERTADELIKRLEAALAAETAAREAAEAALSELRRFAQVRVLAKDLDLTTPEGEQEARRLLAEYDLPQHHIYGINRAPITDDTIRRAEAVYRELSASPVPPAATPLADDDARTEGA